MRKRFTRLVVTALTLVMIYSSCFTASAAESVINNGADKEEAIANLNIKGETVVLDGVFMNEEARKTFDAVNALRAEKGVAPLVWANDFDFLGKLRAAEIQEIYSHSRPNGEARTIIKDGKVIVTGENIAMGYTSAEEVMEGWTKSLGHYENMTDVDYQSYYCACFVTYDETYGWPWYTWVQLFSFDKLDSNEKESNVTVPGNNTITIQCTENAGNSTAEKEKKPESTDTTIYEHPVLSEYTYTDTTIYEHPVLSEYTYTDTTIYEHPVLSESTYTDTTIYEHPVLSESMYTDTTIDEPIVLTEP